MLVKCSLNGEDPYWGRVVSELGTAGVAFEHDRVAVAYGGVAVCARAGWPPTHDRAAVAAHLAGTRTCEICCDLGLGAGSRGRAHHRPRARLHRREPDDVVTASGPRRPRSPIRPRSPPCWSRRCPTSGGSPARSSSSSTGATPWPGSPGPRAGALDAALASFAEDVVLVRSVGMLPVVVHGGRPPDRRADGPARQGGRVPRRPAGDRRRDPRHRPHGAGGQGQPGHRLGHQRPRPAGRRALGRGRRPDHRRPARRRARLRRRRRWRSTRPSSDGCWPRASSRCWPPSAADAAGQAYNINADTVAGAVAEALGAEKLVFLTDVEGIRADPVGPRLAPAPGHRGRARRPGGLRPRPGRDGAQGRGLRPGRAGRGAPGPHPRRPGTPRPLARAVHRRGGGDDGAAVTRPQSARSCGTYAEPPVTFVRGDGTLALRHRGPALPRLRLRPGRHLPRPRPSGGGRGGRRPGGHALPRLEPLRQRARARGGRHPRPADRRGHRARRRAGLLLPTPGPRPTSAP